MLPPNQLNKPAEGSSSNPLQSLPDDKTRPVFQGKPPKKNKNPWLPIVLSIGFLLMVATSWLTYTSISTTRALEQKIAELEAAEKLRAELDNQYNQAIAELESLKGENQQINALIEQQKAELLLQKNQIAILLTDKKKLDEAKAEINNLKARLAEYIAEIEQLRAQQESLTEENIRLKEDKQSMSAQLEEKIAENESLHGAKALLVSEKESLSKAVEAGSVIKVKDINVTGLKVKKSGKTAERTNAKRVDQLRVCFTTVANELARPGLEKFYIRITTPDGETLAIEDLSDSTIFTKSGEKLTYTQVQEYEYANDETQLCFDWQSNVNFKSGKYNVEIYNKGMLAGNSSFELK